MALSRYTTTPFDFGFYDYIGPTTTVVDPDIDLWMPVLGDTIVREPTATIRRSSPAYEINETDNTYQIFIQAPGVKASDIDAQLEDNGRTLHVTGARTETIAGTVSTTSFDQRFTIGDRVDASNLTADLTNGVLTVTAPKTKKRQPTPQKIDVSQGLLA